MIFSESRLRQQIVKYCQAMHARGWASYHDGNITARVSAGRFLTTPTATSKAEVTAESLVLVDAAGKRLSGRPRPFGELPLHLAIYKCRPDVNCVVHAHPPFATAFALCGLHFGAATMAEFVVAIGESVPLVPYAVARSPQMAAEISKAALSSNALLLSSHGAVTAGETVEQAFLRMELIEQYAKINFLARLLGEPKSLQAADVQSLAEERRKAGLQPAIPAEKREFAGEAKLSKME